MNWKDKAWQLKLEGYSSREIGRVISDSEINNLFNKHRSQQKGKVNE